MFLQISDEEWIAVTRIRQIIMRDTTVKVIFTDGTWDFWPLTDSDDPAVLAEARAALLARIAAVPVCALGEG